MKHVLKRMSLVLGLVLANVPRVTDAGVAPPRTVTVQVTVSTEPGGAVPHQPFQVITGVNDYFGRTDANGVAVITAMVGEDETSIIAAFAKTTTVPAPPEADSDDVSRLMQLVRSHRFEPYRGITLQPGVDTYAVTYVGTPAVAATGRIVDPHGNPRWGIAYAAGSATAVRADRLTGEFTVGGLAPNADGEVVVVSLTSSVARAIRLTAQQTAADVALGDIVIDELSGTALVRITVTNALEADTLVDMLSRKVSLISESGTKMIILDVSDTGVALEGLGRKRIPAVPPGRYYVIPGLPYDTDVSERLRMALRTGQDLTGSGVPVIEAVEQTVPVELQIDAVQVRDAVMALP